MMFRNNTFGSHRRRFRNPVLNSSSFENLKSSRSVGPIVRDDIMTIQGTVDKTGICIAILIFAGFFAYIPNGEVYLIIGFVGGIISLLATIIKKTWSPITVPLYAMFEGLLLGSISYKYGELYDGVVFNAIVLTITILISVLILYKSGQIKATENFRRSIMTALLGIVLVYIFAFIASFFGINLSFLNPTNGSLFSLGFSLAIIVVASLSLVLDFNFIEDASKKGAPKYMEWFGAFGILVTLIWLYIEIVRFLAKLNSRK